MSSTQIRPNFLNANVKALQARSYDTKQAINIRAWSSNSDQYFLSLSKAPYVLCKPQHRNLVLMRTTFASLLKAAFTRQTKVGKLVLANSSWCMWTAQKQSAHKFYLSPTVCQRVCRLFLRRSHTPTRVYQHEFANFSLPCEGRLKDFWLIKLIASRPLLFILCLIITTLSIKVGMTYLQWSWRDKRIPKSKQNDV